MSIKISCMYYLKQTRVILPVAFEESEVVICFFATFFFSLSLSIGKRSNLAKSGRAAAPPPLGFYGPGN